MIDPVHGLGLGLGVYAAFAAVLMLLAGLGVVLGYHRVLTHRAAKLHPAVEKALVTLGCPAGTPVQWIGNHRRHHAVADTEADIHSPVRRGFWTAHAGWYLGTERTLPAVLYTFAGPLRMLFDAFWRPRTNQDYAHLARDVAADRYYAFLSTRGGYACVMLVYLAFLYGSTWLLFGLSMLPVSAGLHVLAYAAGDFVNSVGHGRQGRVAYPREDASRNVWWVGLLALGDGFHNTHHAWPSSIRSGFGWREPDVAFYVARGLEALGLARDLKYPPVAAPRGRPQEETHAEIPRTPA